MVPFKKYCCAATWEELRVKRLEVTWWKLFWFNIPIPGHAFIGWLAKIKKEIYKNKKLPTKERMLQWRFTGDSNYVICRGSIEHRDHLFFKAPSPKESGRSLWVCLILVAKSCWQALEDQCSIQLKGKVLKTTICKLAWWAIVYICGCRRMTLFIQGGPTMKNRLSGI